MPPTIRGGEGDRDWDPNAMKPFGPKPIPEHRWFESKPLVARLFILIAGVTMNAVLALVIDIGSLAAYGRPYYSGRRRFGRRWPSRGARGTPAW